MINNQSKKQQRKTVSLESLKVTPPLTAEEIQKRIRQGRVAEMNPHQAGLDKI
jgi:hypothetical protein